MVVDTPTTRMTVRATMMIILPCRPKRVEAITTVGYCIIQSGGEEQPEVGMENSEIAAVFEEIANLTRILQEGPKWAFKAVAYERAKRSIESYSERLEDLARDPKRKLTEVPGVGTDLAGKI